MGYTHYWYRPEEIKPDTFRAIVADTEKVLAEIEGYQIPLAGPMGTGRPELTDDLIAFNGSDDCGHPKDASVVIPWPTEDAGGVQAGAGLAGSWFAGATLETRTCDGSCSYESFVIERVMDVPDYQRGRRPTGPFFECCKTAFRPYDLAVTATLIIATHHLGGALIVRSDGEAAHWFDGAMLCQSFLGYGLDFKLDESP
jgi:hypothetical protein